MHIQVPINKGHLYIPEEVRQKWQTFLDTMVKIIDVRLALVAEVKPSGGSVLLFSKSSEFPGKFNIQDYLIESYYTTVIATKSELLITNAFKEKKLDTSWAKKSGMISCFSLPIFWPDSDVFGIIFVFDIKENHYRGTSNKLIVQCKELVEAHLSLLCQTQQLEFLLESLGDIKESFYPEASASVIITSNSQDNITFLNREAESVFGYTSTEIIGKPLVLLIAEPFHKTYEDMRCLILEEGKNFNRKVLNISGVRKDGVEFPMELNYTIWKMKDNWHFAAIVRLTSERKRLGDMLQMRNRELYALNSISKSISQSLKLNEILRHGLGTFVEILGITAAAIYILDQDTGGLSLAYQQGLTKDLKKSAGKVLSELDDTSMTTEITRLNIATDIHRHNSMQSVVDIGEGQCALIIPLVSRGKVLGVSFLVEKSVFDAERSWLLQTANSQIAAAIDNALLFEKMEKISITDSLTELYNRRHFREVIQAEIDRLLRYGGFMSLIILDLDGFKEFNDQHGHLIGDMALQAFAQTLRATLRKTDHAFRYGGDEFAIILPMTKAKKAKATLDRLKTEWVKVFSEQQIASHSPLEFSDGIAEFTGNTKTADTLIMKADAALYRSKRRKKQAPNHNGFTGLVEKG